MKKLVLLLIVPFALLLGAQTASAQKSATPRAGTSAAQAAWNSYQSETITGTISMIVVDQKMVVVESSGIPYDITITKKTKIDINGTTSTFSDLVGQTQKQVTVTFVARPKGDFAQSISVSD